MKVTIHASEFEEENDEQEVAHPIKPGTVAAIVSGTDWTTETIISQLKKQNIQLKPRFQRRDAWKIDRKSRFIESLILGLPVPQIVLAESKTERGRFIVLDGKQRLLSILQFWGLGEGDNNAYKLSGLPLRRDLNGTSFSKLSSDTSLTTDYDELCNRPIRTMVILNWRDIDFLHTVFLRLNTGSVSLSPQELRQALLPGEFTNYIDDAASASIVLQKLLGTKKPDPRMRDVEILARYFAFHFFSMDYPGRMKKFIDESFEKFNDNWKDYQKKIETALAEFEKGVEELINVFGEKLARKPASPQFNRAIFDALIYFYSQPKIRTSLKTKKTEVKKAYESLFTPGSKFVKAIESDTAGAPNTLARLQLWAAELSRISGENIKAPKISVAVPKASPKKASITKKSRK
jgi:hypothetical protein